MNISKEQYLNALEAVWKEHDRDMLQAYIDLDGCKASSEQIARILGKSSLVVINGKFGRLGRRIADFLDYAPPLRKDETSRWWFTLAEGKEEDNSFKWILRPAFVAALNDYGIQKSETILPDELPDDPKEYVEGAKRQIIVNAYERNREARKICIQKYGASCQVCEFDFEQTYGVLGKGFIHVHHVEPLAAKNETYQVDPEKDLIPVCPNCHAMLHKKNPPIPIEELRKVIKENKLVLT
ncbi:HNH endonuclease [Catalinimonas sp. 4WD22]|uniref:HNH endonuclease n=1 Tax=Catalinimonas locisalis TaxID=3133978 RepID=UPI0031019211